MFTAILCQNNGACNKLNIIVTIETIAK